MSIYKNKYAKMARVRERQEYNSITYCCRSRLVRIRIDHYDDEFNPLPTDGISSSYCVFYVIKRK